MKKTISWGDEQGFQIGVRRRGGCCSQNKGQGLVFGRLENTIKKKIRFEFCSCLLPSMHPRHTRHAHCPGTTKTRALTLTVAAQTDGRSISWSEIRAVQRATRRNHRNQEGTESPPVTPPSLPSRPRLWILTQQNNPQPWLLLPGVRKMRPSPRGATYLRGRVGAQCQTLWGSVCFWCQGVPTLGLFSPWLMGSKERLGSGLGTYPNPQHQRKSWSPLRKAFTGDRTGKPRSTTASKEQTDERYHWNQVYSTEGLRILNKHSKHPTEIRY